MPPRVRGAVASTSGPAYRPMSPPYGPMRYGRTHAGDADGAARAAQRFERAGDQFGPCRREHLQRDVLGHLVLLDQLTHEIKIGLRCRRKAHLDLREAGGHQQMEEAVLARRIHRLDQRLVAVAQVDAAPLWRLLQLHVGPATMRRRRSAACCPVFAGP